jgi:hypothetical protein
MEESRKMSKKVSYINLLKEAISEYDTSKTVDVKGPFLDAIVSYKGDGELPTHKDAASILERYYYNQERDKGVEVNEEDYLDDGKGPKTASMKHGEGEGTEQAGTDEKLMDKGSKEIAKEQDEMDDADEAAGEAEEEMEESVREQDEEEGDEEEAEDEEEMTESVENAIIEKLISELEEQDEMEDEDEEGDEEEVEEAHMTYKGDGVKPGMNAPKEKEMKDTEEHSEGEGTEQAGTGDAEGQVPSRKDQAEKMVKPKKYVDEQDEGGEEEEEEGEEEEMEEGTPLQVIAQGRKEDGDKDYMEEAFKLFKEEIEAEDDEEIDVSSDDLKA